MGKTKQKVSAADRAQALEFEAANDALDKATTAVAHAASTLVDGAQPDVTRAGVLVDADDFANLKAEIAAWGKAGNDFLVAARKLVYTPTPAVVADTPETVAVKARSAREAGDAFKRALAGGKS